MKKLKEFVNKIQKRKAEKEESLSKRIKRRKVELIAIQKEIERDPELTERQKEDILERLKPVIAEYNWLLKKK